MDTKSFFHSILLFLLSLVLTSCEKYCFNSKITDSSTILTIQQVYERSLSELEECGHSFLLKNHLSLGSITPLWIATRQSSGSDTEDSSAYVTPIHSEFHWVFTDSLGHSFNSLNYLYINGERCHIVTEIDAPYSHKDPNRFSGLRIYQSLHGDLFKMEKWIYGKRSRVIYFDDNSIINQFQEDLANHILFGLHISVYRNSVEIKTITRSDPDTLDSAVCYGTYIPTDWGEIEWWNQFYFQFLSDSLAWSDLADTVDIVEDDWLIEGGYGGGGGGSGCGSEGGNGNGGNGNNNTGGEGEAANRPTDLSNLIGDPGYYLARYNDYLSRYGGTADTTVYYKQYGDRYYQDFMNLKTRGTLSALGEQWIDDVACLLQEKLEAILRNNPTIEDDPALLRSCAFLSHVFAYQQAGFLNLPMDDKIQIGLTIRLEDLTTREGLLQLSAIAVMQLLYYASSPSLLQSDASYIMNNWTSIKNDVFNYLYQTRTSGSDEEVLLFIDMLLGQQIRYYYENVTGFSLPDF